MNLIETDGEVDFSILSALGSNKKQVRKTALTTLISSPASLKQLSFNEASLLELFLAQIIQRCQDEEDMMQSML